MSLDTWVPSPHRTCGCWRSVVACGSTGGSDGRVAPTHSHFLRHEERAGLDTSHPDESWWRAERQVKTFRNGTAWADVHPHLPERGSGVRQVVGWKATPYRGRGPALLRHRCEDTSARSHERKIAWHPHIAFHAGMWVPSTRKKPARGPAFFCCLVGDTGIEPVTSTV